MASITIRNLPEETKQRLKQRATHHGRSMEEEARRILDAAVRDVESDVPLGQWLEKISRPGFDLDISRDRSPHEPLDLDR